MPAPIGQVKNRFLHFYQRHEALVSLLVFLAGFIFDVLTLGRIDDVFNLLQESLYLVVLGLLLVVEIKIKNADLTLSPKAKKLWQYHDLLVHFLFGSLLSAYTIFFYTSASALTSFLFILLLAGLMLANEFPRVQQLGLPIRVGLFNICLLSFLSILYPILFGKVGPVYFWLGFLTSLGLMILLTKLSFGLPQNLWASLLMKQVLLPTVATHAFFVLGYTTSLMPPVPLAVKKMGIYYEVKKENNQYIGLHLNPPWKFWHHGAQNFKARPGDKIVVILAIFSPAHFQDKIFLQWDYDHPGLGYRQEDSIPLTILGGREEGFRGFAIKQNYLPGNWKIRVVTSDGREVGRISLEVQNDSTTELREFKQDIL